MRSVRFRRGFVIALLVMLSGAVGAWAAEPDDAAALVLEILKGGDQEMTAVAIGMVKELPGVEVTKALAKELPNLASASQVQLLAALGDRGDAAALPAVVELTKAKDQAVRVAAIKALGSLGDASTVVLLAQMAAATSGEEQKAARESLYRLRGQNIDKVILDGVPKAEAKSKVELISAVGERNVRAGVDVVLLTAKDSDRQVRAESFRVLKVICGPENLPALVNLLVAADSTSDRTEAEKTVAAVAHKVEDKNRQAEAVLAVLPKVTDAAKRASVLSALGRIGDGSALPVLRKELASSNADIRTAAIRALAMWPTGEPAEDLYAVAKGSDNELQRVLAIRGFVELLGKPGGRGAKETVRLYREAMKLAPNQAEKTRVLSGLANAGSIDALNMAVECMADSSLGESAEAAVVKIAGAVYGGYPQQTKEILRRILEGTKNESLREQAQQIVNQIDKFDDYITAWVVTEPYTKEGADLSGLFDAVFEPEKPSSAGVAWRIMPAGTDAERPWLLELDKLYSGDNRAAYLRTKVWSANEQKVVLELGSDDGVKVWLNGQLVHANNTVRPVSPGEDKVEVNLKQGWNTLLVKLTQGGGQWALCARIRKADGVKIEGLKSEAQD
jgi:HEAT repeat protein